MVDFGPDKVFYPNLLIAISQEMLGVRSRNFQSFHISMTPTNGAKMKKFWEVRVSCPGWSDMELSFPEYVLACKKISRFIHSFRDQSPMPIFDHNQPKIIKAILNFHFLTRLITDFTFGQKVDREVRWKKTKNKTSIIRKQHSV